MPSQPPLGSTSGTPQTPAAPSAQAGPRVLPGRRCVVLVDWWLERVEGEEGKIRVAGITHTPQMRKGASSSKGNRKVASRMFRSSTIVGRHDYDAIESEDGHPIRIGCLLNIPKTLENGFSQEVIAMIGLQGPEFWKVCECFEFGFPILWHRLVNQNMEMDNEHARSPSEFTANAPSHSVEYYMEKFLSDSFTENAFYSSVGYTGNNDGLATQSLSNLSDDNAGNVGLYGPRMDVPEEPLVPPGETCNSGQESDRHESIQIDANKQEIVNRSIISVSVNQSTSSISPNSKADGNILEPPKIMSVVKEGYRSRVGCVQAEADVDIQQENMHNCSSEHEMVTLPEPQTPKRGKASVNLGTTYALELRTEGMTAKFAAIVGSEGSTVRRLRSGKVFGTQSGERMKKGLKQKKIQQETSSKQMVNEGVTSTVDLTSHGNGFSAAEIVVEEKSKLQDSHRKAAKRARREKKSAGLFWNWVRNL